MKDWIKQLEQRHFGSSSYSQSYQDALIDFVFDNISTVNEKPFCVEFGFNSDSLTVGTGANVSKLVLEHGWDSLLLDGTHQNSEINLYRHFLTPDNICGIFKQYGVPKEPEYISIDVDSLDLWLFEAILRDYRALLFSVEYNANYPLDKAITFPNDPTEHWERDCGYGASLRALTMVAEQNGYSLLWVIPPLDAFFIRNDLIDDGSGDIVFPFTKWKGCTGISIHARLKRRERVSIFMDYEVYQQTNGDIAASRAAGRVACEQYLLGYAGPTPLRRRLKSWMGTQLRRILGS